MKFQPGVVREGVCWEIGWALGMADMLHRKLFQEEVEVTSLRDHHEHKPASLHNAGRAADLRTRNLSDLQRKMFFGMLRAAIDPHGFDTVDEGNHLHFEYDPKPGEAFAGEAPS